MDLTQANAVFLKACDCLRRLLVFDRKMARVVVNPQTLFEPVIAGVLIPELIEKLRRLQAVLDQAEGLGFESKVQGLSGASAQTIDVLNTTPEVVPDELDLAGLEDEFFE